MVLNVSCKCIRSIFCDGSLFQEDASGLLITIRAIRHTGQSVGYCVQVTTEWARTSTSIGPLTCIYRLDSVLYQSRGLDHEHGLLTATERLAKA